MTSDSTHFTLTNLMAEAVEILQGAGFKTVKPSAAGTWKAAEARVFEDEYSIVCIAVYETWSALSSLWRDDQSSLAGLISRHFTRTEAKAWDGYLVLLTPSVVPKNARQEAVDIRRDTTHVRKLLCAGDELGTADVVGRTLLPLLPLESQDVQRVSNVLDTLPPLLASHGVNEEAAKVAVEAFLDERPIIEAIHKRIAKERGH